MVKNPPANAGDLRDAIRPLGREDPLVEGMAPHSSIIAWRIPRTEEPRRLQSVRSHSRTRLKQLSMHACIGLLSFPASLHFLFTLAFLGLRSQITW